MGSLQFPGDFGFEFESPDASADDQIDGDDLGFDFDRSEEFEDEDSLFTRDELPQVAKPAMPSVSRAKKVREAPDVATRGSAAGKKPEKVRNGPVALPVPYLNIARREKIQVAGVGQVTIGSIVYDEAENSMIYKATSDAGAELVVKMEFRSDEGYPDLDNEVRALKEIGQAENIIKLIDAPQSEFTNAKGKSFKYEVLEALDRSLADFYYDREPVSQDDLFSYAKQGISALEHIHAAGYVHGDVGPGNFMVKQGVLKAIDFGYARKYLDPATGEHLAPGVNRLGGGATSQLSISELEGHFPSRRDDMMRFGEVLLKVMNSGFIHTFRDKKTAADLIAHKMSFVPSECCKRADTNMEPFDRYFEIVRTLTYEETPNYEALRALFA